MKNVYTESAAASRYDLARTLPAETQTLWLEALSSVIPKQDIKSILDLGCGTGRFTAALAQEFACSVIGVEPSAAMLDIARSGSSLNIEWKQAAAEQLLLADGSVDLVFMSQVFHHLVDPNQGLREIYRVLTRSGYLAIRNGVREENDKLAWLEFFPEAREIEERRTPFRNELKQLVSRHSFVLVSHQIINQQFASSYDEYVEKISQRGLSSLIEISDEVFEEGSERLRSWAASQPPATAVYELIDLFVFQKKPPNYTNEFHHTGT